MRYSVFLTFAIVVTHCEPALGDESATYAQIEPSLAFVAASSGKAQSFGTAFCIETRGDYGFLLTNKHVLNGDSHPSIVLMSDPKHVLRSVVIRDAVIDAVVLAIHQRCVPLVLSNALPTVGTRVALAGFPAFQIRLFLRGYGLAPSFHEGTISSIIPSANVLQYDAQTDHGNSGSPLFDADSGIVYGLVTAINTGESGALQNNIAISSSMLLKFVDNARRDISMLTPVASDRRPETAIKSYGAPAPIPSVDFSTLALDTNYPANRGDPEEQHCVSAVAVQEWSTVVLECNNSGQTWEHRAQSLPPSSDEYYDALYTAAYYDCYGAIGLYATFHADIGASVRAHCRQLFRKVLDSRSSSTVDEARDAEAVFESVFHDNP